MLLVLSFVMSVEVAFTDNKTKFTGKYVLVRNENLDQFLIASGTTNEVTLSRAWPSKF